jgi:hypothetical protein
MFRVLRLVAVAVVVGALFVALSSVAQESHGLSPADAGAVRANLGFAGADPIDAPGKFFGQFTEDVHWNYRGDRADGMEALRKLGWCHSVSGENTVKKLEGVGEWAYALGTYRLSLKCGDRAPVNVEGEFVTVHRKDRRGSWRIAVYVAGE